MFLYKKIQQLNNALYKIHLKAAQDWGSSWYIILGSIIDSTNLELERKYKDIDSKLNKLIVEPSFITNWCTQR